MRTWLTIIIYILPNISQNKGNQTFDQVIEYNNRNIFLNIMQKMRQGNQFQTSHCFLKSLLNKKQFFIVSYCFLLFFLYEVKANGLQLSFYLFRYSPNWQTFKTKFIKFQNIDPEICSILSFQKRVWELFIYRIYSIIF